MHDYAAHCGSDPSRSGTIRHGESTVRTPPPDTSADHTTTTCAAPSLSSPITAARSKPSCGNIESTWLADSGAQATSRPPLVCGSVSNALRTVLTLLARLTSLPYDAQLRAEAPVTNPSAAISSTRGNKGMRSI